MNHEERLRAAQQRWRSALRDVFAAWNDLDNFSLSRNPHQSDEDDALEWSAEALEHAARCVRDAHRRLKEGC